jgi:hypothetical protein
MSGRHGVQQLLDHDTSSLCGASNPRSSRQYRAVRKGTQERTPEEAPESSNIFSDNAGKQRVARNLREVYWKARE